MIYPTKNDKYDLDVWCNNFREIEAEITKLKQSSGSTTARIGEVTLTASGWRGSASPYSQVVQINGVTKNSQVDLTPSVQQLAVFHEKDLTFVTETMVE